MAPRVSCAACARVGYAGHDDKYTRINLVHLSLALLTTHTVLELPSPSVAPALENHGGARSAEVPEVAAPTNGEDKAEQKVKAVAEAAVYDEEVQREAQRLRERHLMARRRLRSLRTQQIVEAKKEQAIEQGIEVSDDDLSQQAQVQAKQEVEERVKLAISASEAEGAAALFSTVGIAAATAIEGLDSMTEDDKKKVLSVPEDQKVALSDQLLQDAMNVAARARQLSVYSEADRTKLRDTSAELQAERAKSSELGSKLDNVTSKLAKSTSEVASLQSELQTARSEFSELKDVENQLQQQLKETRQRLMLEQKTGRALKHDGAKLRSQLSNLQGELNSTNFKLDQEKAKSEEKDKAITYLKEELNHSINTYESEQDKTKQLNMDLIRMQRALSSVKTEKEKAEARVDVLSGRIKNAEARATKYQGELQGERAMRTDATAAVMKLQEIISSVKAEKNAAVTAAGAAVEELGQEKVARVQAERTVSEVREQLESIRANAEERAAEAHQAMQAFRDEVEIMKAFGEESMNNANSGQHDSGMLRQELGELKAEDGAGQNGPASAPAAPPAPTQPKPDAFYSW